jgi:hypothetical protein
MGVRREVFITETFERYGHGVTPFGVRIDEIVEYATSQFVKRLDRIERGARARSLSAVEDLANEDLIGDDSGDGEEEI